MTDSSLVSNIGSRFVHRGAIRGWQLALAAIGTLAIIGWSLHASEPASFDPRCEPWDRAASGAVSELIADRSPAAEQRLSDAVFRLRRARKYCRHDLPGLARLDYEALIDGRHHRTQ